MGYAVKTGLADTELVGMLTLDFLDPKAPSLSKNRQKPVHITVNISVFDHFSTEYFDCTTQVVETGCSERPHQGIEECGFKSIE